MPYIHDPFPQLSSNAYRRGESATLGRDPLELPWAGEPGIIRTDGPYVGAGLRPGALNADPAHKTKKTLLMFALLGAAVWLGIRATKPKKRKNPTRKKPRVRRSKARRKSSAPDSDVKRKLRSFIDKQPRDDLGYGWVWGYARGPRGGRRSMIFGTIHGRGNHAAILRYARNLGIESPWINLD